MEEFFRYHPMVLTYVCAELFFILARKQEIVTVFRKHSGKKNANKRRYDTNAEIGLRRDLFLEALVFVPVSVTLFRLTIFPFISSQLAKIGDELAEYSVVGVLSYGFPYIALRGFLWRMIIRTLQETFPASDEAKPSHENPASDKADLISEDTVDGRFR